MERKKKKKKIMAEIVATNFNASRPPNSDRPLVPKSKPYSGCYPSSSYSPESTHRTVVSSSVPVTVEIVEEDTPNMVSLYLRNREAVETLLPDILHSTHTYQSPAPTMVTGPGSYG